MEMLLNPLVLLANFILVPGLAYGSQLALGALGVTMVYAVLNFSNFSHGEVMSFGAMVTMAPKDITSPWLKFEKFSTAYTIVTPSAPRASWLP